MVRGKDLVEFTYNLLRTSPRVCIANIAPFKDAKVKVLYVLNRIHSAQIFHVVEEINLNSVV